jgi:hypothetical protein
LLADEYIAAHISPQHLENFLHFDYYTLEASTLFALLSTPKHITSGSLLFMGVAVHMGSLAECIYQ